MTLDGEKPKIGWGNLHPRRKPDWIDPEKSWGEDILRIEVNWWLTSGDGKVNGPCNCFIWSCGARCVCANLCRGMALEKVEGDSDSPANNGYFLTALIGYSGGGAMKLARR